MMTLSRKLGWVTLPMAATAAWYHYSRAAREISGFAPASPVLPGTLRAVAVPWGVMSYRIIEGDATKPALVLVHGWGRTADSAWWPLVWKSDRTLVLIDLPGHGRSTLHVQFSFELAAEAVRRTIVHAQLERPVLVGHSMGGAVALSTVRLMGSAAFSGLVLVATAAHWVKPRIWVSLAAAPYVMAPRSPVILRRQRRAMREMPQSAARLVWEYAARPARILLEETAVALRCFDVREWKDLDLPPTTWVVTARDGVIEPDHQRNSARQLGARIVELDAEHSLVPQVPDELIAILESAHLPQPSAATSFDAEEPATA